jgi:hypothetical protein
MKDIDKGKIIDVYDPFDAKKEEQKELSIFTKIVTFFKHFNLLVSLQLMDWHKNRFDAISRKLLYLQLGYKNQREFNQDTAKFFSRLIAVKEGKTGGDMSSVSRGKAKRLNMEIAKYISDRDRVKIEDSLNDRDIPFLDEEALEQADRRSKALQMLIRSELKLASRERDELI